MLPGNNCQSFFRQRLITKTTMTEDVVRANKYKFFTVGAIGTFMGTLNGSILNVALPTIAGAFNVGVDVVAWVVLAYSLALVSLMMVFGAWAGRRGYAAAYKFGYALFLAGSVICIFSWSIYALILGRVIQAVGAAMFQAVGTGMVTQVFPEKERGKGIGMMVMMVATGLMTGPVLGGLLLDIWPWQSIFVINIPVSLFGLWFAFKYFKMLKPEGQDGRMKIAGAMALSLGLASMMLALSLLSDYPLSDVRVWGLGLLALLAFLAFHRYETRPQSSLIGLDIFNNRVFSSSLAAMLTLFASMSGVLILVPFYLEHMKHLRPREVGFYLIILPVLMFICAPLAGRLSDRIGYRFLTVFGVLANATGLFMLTWLEADSSAWYLIFSLVVMGVGCGVFNTPNSSALMGSVRKDQRAIASGILSTTRVIGMAVGISVATALFAYFQQYYESLGQSSGVFMASYHNVIFISVIIALLGLPFCLLRGRVAKPSENAL